MSVHSNYELELHLNRENMCRLCLNTGAMTKLNCENSLKTSLKEQIFELLDINLTENMILDKICWACNEKIQEFHNFKNKCKDANEKLKSMINKRDYVNVELIKHKIEEKTCDNKNTNDILNCSEDLNASSDTEPLIKIARTKKKIKKRVKEKQKKPPFYCIFCHKDLLENKDFEDHNAKIHGIINGQYQCYGCMKVFVSQQSRYIHERKSCKILSNGFKCSVCEDNLPSRRLLEKHCRNHENNILLEVQGKVKCKQCKEIFETKDTLIKHTVQAHHKKFVCESCGCMFRRQDYLHKHKLIHSGVKRHACPHCSMRFIQRSGLTVHIRKHTGERPFKCEMCPHRCVTSSNLREHRRRHQGDKRHQCTICDRKFGYKRSLEEHTASVHERSLPHPCAHCGANYTNKRGLRRHMLNKHADVDAENKGKCQQIMWNIKMNTDIEKDSLNITSNKIV